MIKKITCKDATVLYVLKSPINALIVRNAFSNESSFVFPNLMDENGIHTIHIHVHLSNIAGVSDTFYSSPDDEEGFVHTSMKRGDFSLYFESDTLKVDETNAEIQKIVMQTNKTMNDIITILKNAHNTIDTPHNRIHEFPTIQCANGVTITHIETCHACIVKGMFRDFDKIDAITWKKSYHNPEILAQEEFSDRLAQFGRAALQTIFPSLITINTNGLWIKNDLGIHMNSRFEFRLSESSLVSSDDLHIDGGKMKNFILIIHMGLKDQTSTVYTPLPPSECQNNSDVPHNELIFDNHMEYGDFTIHDGLLSCHDAPQFSQARKLLIVTLAIPVEKVPSIESLIELVVKVNGGENESNKKQRIQSKLLAEWYNSNM
jgi:hypothetical protein